MLGYPKFADITARGFSEQEAMLMLRSMRENGGHPDLHWQILLGSKPAKSMPDLEIDIFGRKTRPERKAWFSQ